MKKKDLKLMLLAVLAFVVVGCGGSSSSTTTTAPTISAFKDAQSATIAATESAGVYPSQFSVTFDQAMDDASVTTAGNVTMTCGSLTPTFTVAALVGTAYTYGITVTDSWKYALLSCTITFTTNVKSSDGTALAAAAAYTFTNACAVNDDFNIQSMFNTTGTNCWTYVGPGSDTKMTEAEGSAAVTWDTTNSMLDINMTSSPTNKQLIEEKIVRISEDGFSAEMTFSDVSGFNSESASTVGIVLTDSLSAATAYIITALEGSVDGATCSVMFIDTSSGFNMLARASASCAAANTTYKLKLSVDASIVATVQYKVGDAEYQNIPLTVTSDYSAVAQAVIGTEKYAMFTLYHRDTNDIVSVDAVEFTGVTSSTQY